MANEQTLVKRTAKNCGRCSTFCSLGTSILRAFLIIGWGFSSSSENRCRRGSNASWPGTLDSARSAGSGSKFTMMSLPPLATAGGPGGPGGQVEVGDGSWGTAWPPGREGGERDCYAKQFLWLISSDFVFTTFSLLVYYNTITALLYPSRNFLCSNIHFKRELQTL